MEEKEVVAAHTLRIFNETDIRVPRKKISALYADILRCHCSLNVVFIDNRHSRELNRQYRGKDSATNILSFPADGCGVSAREKIAEAGDSATVDSGGSAAAGSSGFTATGSSGGDECGGTTTAQRNDPATQPAEIYINAAMARHDAEQLGIPLSHRIFFLAIHGMLHLLNHRHGDAMEKLEDKYATKYIYNKHTV